jgi:hypothetical protein
VLDQVTISCGDGSGGMDSTCIIDGSREQLIIEDPANTDYTLSLVTIEGLIFNGWMVSGQRCSQFRGLRADRIYLSRMRMAEF